MTGKVAAAVMLVILAAMAFLAWEFLSTERAPIGAAADPARGPEAVTGSAAESDRRSAGSPGDLQRRGDARTVPAEPTGGAPVPVWAVAGRLTGLDRDTPFGAPLRLMPRTQGSPSASGAPADLALAEARIDEAGHFRLVLGERGPRVTSLELVADDPAYMPVQQEVNLPLVHGRLPDVPADLVVEVPVRRATTLVGRVVAAGQSGAGLQVAVFAGLEGRAGSGPLDHTTTRRDGSYRLRVPGTGEYLVLALGASAPALQTLEVTGGGEVPVPDVETLDGVAITGRVRSAAGPLAGLTVRAERPAGAATRLLFAERVVTVHDGAAEYARAIARTDATGRFELNGLAAAEYVLHVDGIPAPGRVDHPALQRRLTAPLENADLLLDVPLVRVDVSAPYRTAATADVTITRGSSTARARTVPAPSHAAAPCYFLVEPGAEYRLSVSLPPFPTLHRLFEAPADGGVHVEPVDLELPATSAALEVVFLEVDDDPPTGLFLDLRSEHGLANVRQAVAVEAGRATLRSLRPGSYRGTLQPLVNVQGRTGFWSPFEVALELRPDGTTTREVRPRRGGRLVVRFEGFEGPAPVSLSVTDADGTPYLITGRDGGLVKRPVLRVDPDTVCTLHPALPEGECEVRVTGADGREVRVPEVIRAGEVTEVLISLDRAP